MLKNKCSVWKRLKFPTFWYNCYYFTWSDTYFIQLETLLISHPSYLSDIELISSMSGNIKHALSNKKLGWCGHCCDVALAGLSVNSFSIPGRNKGLISSSKLPHRIWEPRSLLGTISPRLKQPELDANHSSSYTFVICMETNLRYLFWSFFAAVLQPNSA